MGPAIAQITAHQVMGQDISHNHPRPEEVDVCSFWPLKALVLSANTLRAVLTGMIVSCIGTGFRKQRQAFTAHCSELTMYGNESRSLNTLYLLLDEILLEDARTKWSQDPSPKVLKY